LFAFTFLGIPVRLVRTRIGEYARSPAAASAGSQCAAAAGVGSGSAAFATLARKRKQTFSDVRVAPSCVKTPGQIRVNAAVSIQLQIIRLF